MRFMQDAVQHADHSQAGDLSYGKRLGLRPSPSSDMVLVFLLFFITSLIAATQPAKMSQVLSALGSKDTQK